MYKANQIAEDRCNKDRQDPLNTEDTPVKIFARRYNLKPRSQPDDKLRDFPDEPVPMPPISCLLQGCESVWLNHLQDFNEHCDDRHEGEGVQIALFAPSVRKCLARERQYPTRGLAKLLRVLSAWRNQLECFLIRHACNAG